MPSQYDAVPRRPRFKMTPCHDHTVPKTKQKKWTQHRANSASCQHDVVSSNTVSRHRCVKIASRQDDLVSARRRVKSTPCQSDTVSRRRRAITALCQHNVTSRRRSAEKTPHQKKRCRANTASCQDSVASERHSANTTPCKNGVVSMRCRVKTRPS